MSTRCTKSEKSQLVIEIVSDAAQQQLLTADIIKRGFTYSCWRQDYKSGLIFIMGLRSSYLQGSIEQDLF